MSLQVLISIVIPTYNEEKLYDTLSYLTSQSVFNIPDYKYAVEIIIADYDPENSKVTFDSYQRFLKAFPSYTKRSKFVNVNRSGIAYARHQGIMRADGRIIVNFDADSYFSSIRGVELLVYPILDDECIMTCCDNVMDMKEVDSDSLRNDNMILTLNALQVLCHIQRITPIVCLEPGFAFTKDSYEFVGGFNDIKQGEALVLSPKLSYSFGFNAKKYVPNISVVTSARRAIAATKVGILASYGNYDNAFRI